MFRTGVKHLVLPCLCLDETCLECLQELLIVGFRGDVAVEELFVYGQYMQSTTIMGKSCSNSGRFRAG